MGTCDELFEIMTLVQTGKHPPIPIVLCPRPPGAVKRPSRSSAFSYENLVCTGLLCGRAGRLTAQNGGSRPGQLANPTGVRSSTSRCRRGPVSPRVGASRGVRGEGVHCDTAAALLLICSGGAPVVLSGSLLSNRGSSPSSGAGLG